MTFTKYLSIEKKKNPPFESADQNLVCIILKSVTAREFTSCKYGNIY